MDNPNPQLEAIIMLLRKNNDLLSQLLSQQQPAKVTKEPSVSDKRSVLGKIIEVKEITTKKGDDMAFLTILNAKDEERKLIVFPKLYSEVSHLLREGFLIEGLGRIKEDSYGVSCIMESMKITDPMMPGDD